jgi:hypothetical protein
VRLLAIAVLPFVLIGCGRYEWGTVVSVREDDSTMGCMLGLPTASVRLDDGRVYARCMDVPVGTRAQICLGDCYPSTPIKPDPMTAGRR